MCVNAGQHLLLRKKTMPDISAALTEDRDGVLVAIEVTAGSKTDLFPAAYNEWRETIGCRVTAPASDGKANKAVLHLIATTLGIAPSAVSIHSGARSTQKQILVSGVGKQEVLRKLGVCLK
jgi:uncharacterized protein (TIGR00251 family)